MTELSLNNLSYDSVEVVTEENNERIQSTIYLNSEDDRLKLKSILPNNMWEQIIEVWGGIPSVYLPVAGGILLAPTLEQVKYELIEKMSKQCQNEIIKGFDTILEDGQTHHFSLETTDQLMIQALMLKVSSGVTSLPYHASGEACRYFSPSEIALLNTLMEKSIEYNTTYFNSLRDYINGIETQEELENVYWGIKIPIEYQSEVLKNLVKGDDYTDEE